MVGQNKRLAARDDGAEADQIHSGDATLITLEEALIEVWRQAFAENAKELVLQDERFAITRTSKRRLREVAFRLDGKEIRGLEQNPDTKSRWAAMARDGKKVMQFLVEGRYVACVTDGQVTLYGARK